MAFGWLNPGLSQGPRAQHLARQLMQGHWELLQTGH